MLIKVFFNVGIRIRSIRPTRAGFLEFPGRPCLSSLLLSEGPPGNTSSGGTFHDAHLLQGEERPEDLKKN